MVLILKRYNGNRVDTLRQIAEAGMRDLTAREGMIDRIADLKENDRNSHYFSRGGWHSEGTVRINGVNYWCLGKFAPTTLYAQQTFDANMAGGYLSLTKDIKIGDKPATEVIQRIAERDAKKPISQRRILVPEDQSSEYLILTKDFGSKDVPVFLARSEELASEYGNVLVGKGIISANVYQPSGSEDLAAGFWLCRLGNGYSSNFDGDDGGFLSDSGSSFGVRGRVRSTSASVGMGLSVSDFRRYALPFIASNQKKVFLKGLEELAKKR